MNVQLNRTATRLATAAVAAAALLLAPAAQADDGWSATWSNGHKIDSKDKEFKLKFGGRIMADYTFASVDDSLGPQEDGFEFRRARLFFSGTIYERVSFKAQYDFAGGDADFKDVWISIDNSWGDVRFGHFKEPFSLEELTSSKYLAFLERSLPVEAFSPSRNSGVGIDGHSGDTFNWGVGYFYDADDFASSTGEDNTNLTGRVGFRPIWEDDGARMLHVGLAATSKDRASSLRFRTRPEAHFAESRYVDTGNFAADGATILDGEVAGVFGPFWFAGELIQADVDAPAVGDPSFGGYYLQAGYYLTGEHRRFKASEGGFDRQKPKSIFGKDGGTGAWELVLRLSSIDLTDGGIDGGEQDNYSLAVNWYLNPATRMMVNYVHADVEPGGASADYVLLRWQVDF